MREKPNALMWLQKATPAARDVSHFEIGLWAEHHISVWAGLDYQRQTIPQTPCLPTSIIAKGYGWVPSTARGLGIVFSDLNAGPSLCSRRYLLQAIHAEAERQGVVRTRMIFSNGTMETIDHMMRLGRCHIFLDTPAYNGHTSVTNPNPPSPSTIP